MSVQTRARRIRRRAKALILGLSPLRPVLKRLTLRVAVAEAAVESLERCLETLVERVKELEEADHAADLAKDSDFLRDVTEQVGNDLDLSDHVTFENLPDAMAQVFKDAAENSGPPVRPRTRRT